MTGEELRAWRERLGKDDAWGAALLESLPGAPASAEIGCGPGQGGVRLHAAKSVAFGYAYHAFLRKTLRAALEAEEARQSAERGPVEPVCPEGVTRGDMLDPDDGSPNMMGDLGLGWQVHVSDSGHIRLVDSGSASPALLEYAAALSRYRAALHAASDEQRKLDAVRATEEAHRKARAEYDRATLEYNAAARALLDARREAGL